MKLCKNCKVNDVKIEVIAYYANGRPVFKNLCPDCTRAEWVKYKDQIDAEPRN